MRNVSAVVGLGIAIGVAGFSATAPPWLDVLLVETRPVDPASQSVVIGLLALVAALAAWIPARRAMRVDPARALSWQ
jgi:ABC-type lipoprotein release transport system permease subunit